MSPRYVIMLFLLPSLSFGGDLTRVISLTNNAQTLFNVIHDMFKGFIWLLAIIPMLILLSALVRTVQKYKHMTRSEGAKYYAEGMLQEIFGIWIALIFAQMSIFIMYGTFVSVYADPSGTSTFIDTWNTFVADFWIKIVK